MLSALPSLADLTALITYIILTDANLINPFENFFLIEHTYNQYVLTVVNFIKQPRTVREDILCLYTPLY